MVDSKNANHVMPNHPRSDVEHPHQSIDNLWSKRSEDDVAYQRQAQVTWWTLMGGIALAALLTQLDQLLSETRAGNWYYLLYFFATCFVIVNSWVQTAWGALVLRWPISVMSSLILFFGNLSLSIAALSVTNPSQWYGSISGVILFSVLMQFHFTQQHGRITLPPRAVQRARSNIFVYIVLMLFCLAMMVVLFLFSTQFIEFLFGIAAVILSSLALLWQHICMQEEKKALHLE